MPNHVHILLRPNEGVSLSTIMKSIKSVSSHKINKLLGRSGPVWQPDYFDRYIRDAEHYTKALNYIDNNPVKAGLCTVPSDWPFGSAGTRTPSSASVDEVPHADEGVRVPPPHERHDLSSLRIFASTGEPWNPAPWWWLFRSSRQFQAADHQLLRRHRDLRRHPDGQSAAADKAVLVSGSVSGNGRRYP